METIDTYCLLPDGADIGQALDRLFTFSGELYHDGNVDHPIASAPDAAAAFSRLMRDGDGVRLTASKVDGTQGGWLYRLEDGAAVIGLSGDAAIPGEVFRRKLRQAVPGGWCCTIGDQPPPMSRSEFLRAAGATERREM